MAVPERVMTDEPWVPENTFGSRLVRIRKALDLTQAQAAAACGLDDGSWSNWENGTTPRGLDKVVSAIVTNLNVDRDWLMWGDLRTGRFAHLAVVDGDVSGQGTLLDDDLQPVWSNEKPQLVGIG